MIERLAVRLVSEKKISESLVFKGGYVSLRVYNSPRYTVDLDALRRALNETFRYRGEMLPYDLAGAVQKIDGSLLSKGWKSAVGEIPDATSFDVAFKELVRLLVGI